MDYKRAKDTLVAALIFLKTFDEQKSKLRNNLSLKMNDALLTDFL
jgi:hypothetical protein